MRNVIDSVIRVLCTAIMGIMVVAVCWQITTRYILNNPSIAIEEALRYLLVQTTMMRAACTYGKKKQLSINILLKKVSPPMRKVMDIGVQCLIIVFCIVVVVMGDFRLCTTAVDQSSAALGTPMPHIYSCLLVDAVFFTFYAPIFIGEDVKKLRDNQGQFTAEHSIAEQRNSLRLADTLKNESGKNDILRQCL